MIALIQCRHLFLSPPSAFDCHPLDGFESDVAASVSMGARGPWQKEGLGSEGVLVDADR